MGHMNAFMKFGVIFICINLTLAFFLIVRTVVLPLLEESPCFDDHIPRDDEIFEPEIKTDSVERFRNGLRFKTICWNPENYDRKELQSLISFIKTSYPVVHSSSLVTLEVIANYSLLYKIDGQNKSVLPYLLMAHLDVVPTENQDWKHPPFEADIEDGFIYARGALDDKSNLFGILESLELLLKSGYKPYRSFYIAFGHDEECLGDDGAGEIARLLRKRKVHFEFVLDEGMMIIEDVYVSVKQPVAHIAVAEKGFVSIQISVNHTGGHSSMPEKESSIGILSEAVTKLNSAAHPSRLGYGIEKHMLEAVSYYTSWPLTVVLRNIWFFRPLLSWIMTMKPSTNAIIRTTTAVTMFNSGGKENVIPTYVEAVVNHRIHSSQTVEEIIDHDRKLINDDRVKLKVTKSFEPVPLSCFLPSCMGYQVIKETIRKIWKDVPVVPASLVGNTDSRFFLDLTDNVYRFSPFVLKSEDLKLFHAENERISVESFKTVIRFYYNFYITVDKYHIHPKTVDHQEF